MEQGLDYEVLTNILKFKFYRVLVFLWISMNVVLSSVGLPFDFLLPIVAFYVRSITTEDERRVIWANIPYLLDQFQAVQFGELETISLKSELKKQLRKVIDQIYEEYIWDSSKVKKFIDSLRRLGRNLKEQGVEMKKIAIDCHGW